jgi:uncharacterized protein (TIGR02302 family)
VKQQGSGWQQALRDRGAQWRESWRRTRPRRLTALARAALAFERLARGLAPAAIVIGFFVALSWTGLWLGAPTFLRILGVSAFVGALVAALIPLRNFSWPSVAQARDALDAGDSDAPATALADALANKGDPQTLSLWRLHQRRAAKNAESLRPVAPSPKIWLVDPYALGALAALALGATGLVSGPEKYARVAAAFDWRLHAISGAPTRIDAWIDPPAYTGKPPQVLPLQQAGAAPGAIAAPIGSTIVVRAADAAALRVATQGAIEAAIEAANGPVNAAAKERRFALRGDGGLAIGREGGEIASFTLHAIPDLPPKITPLEPPQPNLRGTFVLSYRIEDDYGARDAQVVARPAAGETAADAHPIVAPPNGSLDLPSGPGGLGEGKTTIDWSDSPYAGAQVDLVLRVHDDGGNEGEAVIRRFVLPGKPFRNPLALALVEQRRLLALDAGQKDKVLAAVDALLVAPDLFTPNPAVYLGLRFVHDSLRHARSDAELVAVVDFLWEMANQIEDGDASQAERDMRAAEKALRDALKNGASPEEIARLTEQLKKALDQYLAALQEQSAKADKSDQGRETETGEGQSVTPQDLQKMLDQMAEAAKDGDKKAAMDMLDRMKDMLENMKTAKQSSERSRQASENRKMMRDIDNLMREQQKLRDDTYAQDRGNPKDAEQDQNAAGEESQNDNSGEQPSASKQQRPGKSKGQKQGQAGATPQPDPGEAAQDELSQRQGQLGEKLDSLKRRAQGRGEKAEGLEEAQEAMNQAQQALKQGDNQSALGSQGKALEGLRKGAAELAQKGGEGSQDDQDEAGEKNGQGLKGQNGEGRYGRANKQNNIDATAAQKARKVLDELRRRLSDPSRAREELDYLERLIRPD